MKNARSATPGRKISVILPNYNHGSYLTHNIKCLIAQTYLCWELVIVDDGSQDQSRTVIEGLANQDSRIRPIYFPQNKGAMAAIRAGLQKVTGELIYGSAADDYISNPRFFEMAVAALNRYPSAAGFFAKAVVVDAKTDRELWTMGTSPSVGFIGPRKSLRAFLSNKLFVPGASSIWIRSLFESIGSFDESLGPQTDYFVNHALPALHGAVFADQTAAVVRTSNESFSGVVSDEDFFRRNALVEKRLRSLNLSYDIDPAWFWEWRESVMNGRLGLSRQREFMTMVQDFFLEVHPWEQNSLSPAFRDSREYLLKKCEEIGRELDEKTKMAKRVFDDIAGPIEPSSRIGQTAQSRYPALHRIKVVAWQTMRRLLRKVLTRILARLN